MTTLLVTAQYAIDDYFKFYWEPFVEWQDFIFPIDVDEVSTIPKDIKLATIRTADYLYLKWTDTVSSLEWQRVLSESNLSRKVELTSISGWYTADIATIQIPKHVLNILNKYKSSFIWQVI
jgi:hypothetical protein